MSATELKASEISEFIKDRIEKFDTSAEERTEGTIISVKDGIVTIHGLDKVMYGEMLEFADGVFGMALNLEHDSVGAVVLGHGGNIAEGQVVK